MSIETNNKNIVKCGCSGIRYCAFCLDSNRVLSKNIAEDTSQFNGYKCCIFSLHEQKAHYIPSLFYNSTLPEIYAKIDSPSNHICSPEYCFTMDGVLILKNFLSIQEEQKLIEDIDKDKWKFSQSGRFKQDFGPKVNFKQRKIKLDFFSGLPEYTDTILNKIDGLNIEKLDSFFPIELCNLDYSPKRLSSIDMHIDDIWIWGERLLSINLLSDSLITLRNITMNLLVFLPLYRRSLLCLSESERYLWEHSILSHHISERRVVITLREAAREFQKGGQHFEQTGRELLNTALRRIPTNSAKGEKKAESSSTSTNMITKQNS